MWQVCSRHLNSYICIKRFSTTTVVWKLTGVVLCLLITLVVFCIEALTLCINVFSWHILSMKSNFARCERVFVTEIWNKYTISDIRTELSFPCLMDKYLTPITLSLPIPEQLYDTRWKYCSFYSVNYIPFVVAHFSL